MKSMKSLSPLPKDFILKITILRSLIYCGFLWGLYHDNHHGWAMTSEQDTKMFPFWLSSVQANKHAQEYWPHYTPRKITPEDFQQSLLPTLVRLNVTPTLYSVSQQKFKLSSQLMKYFFFNNEKHLAA